MPMGLLHAAADSTGDRLRVWRHLPSQICWAIDEGVELECAKRRARERDEELTRAWFTATGHGSKKRGG